MTSTFQYLGYSLNQLWKGSQLFRFSFSFKIKWHVRDKRTRHTVYRPCPTIKSLRDRRATKHDMGSAATAVFDNSILTTKIWSNLGVPLNRNLESFRHGGKVCQSSQYPISLGIKWVASFLNRLLDRKENNDDASFRRRIREFFLPNVFFWLLRGP